VKETPLIDRVEEMAILKEAADKAISDHGGLFFLCGEAGIGKTRLSKELTAYVRSRGVQILRGKCPSLFRLESVSPYVLWKEVIRDYLQICNTEQLQRAVGYYPGEICKLVPEIKQKLTDFTESPPLSAELERDRLFEAVSQFITNISKIAPLLVVLDDLQWCDTSSLLLLHYLGRGVYRDQLMLLGAYRDIEVEEKHPLFPVLTELNRERLMQSARLKRLSLDEVADMIKRILWQDEVPREFCKLVFEKTQGNPFFVEEVIESLREEGIIYPYGVEYRFREISKIEFPETVRSVLQARLARLSEDSQNVLTMASFIGNEFTFEALRNVTGFEESRLIEIIEGITEKRLLKCRVVRGEDTCSFSDVLIKDVLYEGVSPLKRKKLHGIVGCALEKAYAKDIDEHLGELAAHFLESGDKQKALEYFLKAGEKAQKVYANSEAASYFESSLRLLEEKGGEPSEKALVLETLGDIKSLVGDYDACLKYWNEALQLWEHLGEKEKVARLYRKISNVLWIKLGDTDKAKEFQAKALNILEALPESVELASLYADIAEMYWHNGDMAAGLPLAEKAVESAQKRNALEVIARSYIILGKITGWSGDWKKTGEGFEKALKIALENGYIETAVEAYRGLAVEPGAHGDPEKSLECLQKAYELAKKAGAISAQTWTSDILSEMYIGMGNTNMALLLSGESVGLDRKTGNLHNLSRSLVALGNTYETLGEWDKTEEYLNEALTVAQKHNHIPAICNAYFYLGKFHHVTGDNAKAKEFFEKLVETLKKAGIKSVQPADLYGVIWASIELGELDKAENQINFSQAIAQKTGNKYSLAYTDFSRAMLLRVQKKWSESLQYFEKSLQEFETLNAKRWNVDFYARKFLGEYARVYLERDQEGDREKARNLLNQALEFFQKMNAKKDIEKVEAILANIETGRPVAWEPKPTGLVATGYAVLDRLLYGGIRPNSAVALTSPSCDERDSLIKSFLETGAKKGESTFYVTIDPGSAGYLAEEYPASFYLFICNPQAETIVKASPNVFVLKGVENLININIALTQVIRRLEPLQAKPRRICVDLVSDILLQHRSVQTRKWLTELLTQLRSTGFTTLAVINPQMHPSEELYAILSLFEGEVNIREAETDKGLTRFLKVKRLSGQKYLKEETALTEE
jgi:tetratricopeptide (TPR) repeat protein